MDEPLFPSRLSLLPRRRLVRPAAALAGLAVAGWAGTVRPATGRTDGAPGAAGMAEGRDQATGGAASKPSANRPVGRIRS